VHPCEEACRRARVDEPVAICLLKRVAYDKGIENLKGPRNFPPLEVPDKVAIVGSGPAGLSCGYFLRKLGIGSTIFEAMPKAGGLLRYGIPKYRLPEEVLDREIEIIASLGVEIPTNIKFGQDLSLEALRSKGYGAVFLALGAWCAPKLGIENEEHSHVVDSLSFLRDAQKQEMVSGKDVVVIGGGNAAIDCVRTSVRKGARNVILLYRRTREEMPAHREEIQAALEEGVAFRFLVSPVKVVVEEGRLKGLICIENELGPPDASGRRKPVPIEGAEHFVLADIIIPAIGQEADKSSLCDMEGLSFREKGRISVDPETLMTPIEGIFAGGDLVLGPSSVIEAVEQGKRAAYAIKAYLEKRPMDSMPLLPKRYQKVPGIRRAASESLLRSRLEPHCIEGGERVCSFKEVIEEVGGLETQKEAERCLRCDICIGCGRCVSVCREGMQIGALRFSFVEDGPQETDPERAKEACIGCGACATNCPTGAITLEEEGSILSLSLVGVELASHEMVRCKSCGRDYIAPFQRGFIQNGLPYYQRIALEEDLCPECRRRSRSV
ncbi:MAG: FAD-dependent oxidoreductase, partial [Desulfatiglandales bacterium]